MLDILSSSFPFFMDLSVGSVIEWFRCSFFNIVRSSRVALNPLAGTTDHNLKVNSAVHPFEVSMSTQR